MEKEFKGDQELKAKSSALKNSFKAAIIAMQTRIGHLCTPPRTSENSPDGESLGGIPRVLLHICGRGSIERKTLGRSKSRQAWSSGMSVHSGAPSASQAPGARRFEIAFATVTNWGNSVIPLDRRGQTVETIESLGNTGVRPVRSSPCLGFQVPLRWYGCDAQRARPSHQNYYHPTSYLGGHEK